VSRRAAGAFALCAAAAAAPAAAQTTDKPSEILNRFTADLAIPDAPAAAALGIRLEQSVTPRSPRDFAVSLIGLATDTPEKGGALEFSPVWLFVPERVYLGDYRRRDRWGLRALVNTTIGLAVKRGKSGADDVSRTAYAIDTVFLDAGDPVLSRPLGACLNRAQQAELGRIDLQPSPDEEVEDVTTAEFQADVKKCFDRHKKTLWNRSRLAAGLWSGRARDDGAHRSRSLGTTAWVSLAYGFDNFKPLEEPARRKRPSWQDRLARNAQLLLHARRTRGEPAGATVATGLEAERDRTLLAARFTLGDESRALYLETSRARSSGTGARTTTTSSVGGFSYRLTKDTWINLVAGRRKEFGGDEPLTVTASFKFGAESEALVPQR
jgi:hypothetical protein